MPLCNTGSSPWLDSWAALLHSEVPQDCSNIAVMMNVDSVMRMIPFDVHAEVDSGTAVIFHSEALLHLVIHLPNLGFVSNDEDSIDIQNDCGNDNSIALIMQHKQSTVDT
jgi:hypothetical protein